LGNLEARTALSQASSGEVKVVWQFDLLSPTRQLPRHPILT
jgi:hypothetical protein